MKTAVEWIISKLPMVNDNDPYLAELIEYAKEMEKQQIINAHGNKEKKSGGITNYTYILTGEDYYNEIYKNK